MAALRKQGLGVAALTYDSVAVLKNFADRVHITFPLLSDPESKIIRDFGILNEKVPAGPFHGIPHPGTYILDTQGVVTAKYFEDDYTERVTAAEILTRRYGVAPGTEHTTVETRHLRVASSATTSRVRTGQHVALVLDIELKPGMHAYAPGVKGYIPLEWTMAASPVAAAQETVFPKSALLRLPAIQETVPVYKDRIRLVRDLVVSKAAKADFTVEGILRYQACDDKVCYLPQEIALRWSFTIEKHDSTRVPAELRRK